MAKIYKYIALIAFIGVIVTNALANILPIGGQNTGEISDQYPSMFTPVGSTFSIWGVIYLLLSGFVIYQLFDRPEHNQLLKKIRVPFIINCIANICWILVWHHNYLILSLFIMALILSSLIAIYRQLDFWKSHASWQERLFIQAPFSIYFGWISVAILANVSAVQSGMGTSDIFMGEVAWTLLKIILAIFLGLLVMWKKWDWVYGAVIAWASFGIMQAQPEQNTVAYLCMISIGLMAVGMLWSMVKGNRGNVPNVS